MAITLWTSGIYKVILCFYDEYVRYVEKIMDIGCPWVLVKNDEQILLMNTAGGASQVSTFRWRHNGRDNVSKHQPHHCLLNRLLRRWSKKTSKLCVTGLCVRNSSGTGEFPAQMASNAENVSIWWRHHGRSYPINMLSAAHLNSYSPGQNGRHVAGYFLNPFSLVKNCILIRISLFVPLGTMS